MGEVPIATTLRAALAVALLAGFYLLGFALIGGLAWLSVWLWLTFPGEIAQAASYLVVAAAVGLAAATWRLLRARPEPLLDGLTVSEQQAPELWAQVTTMAESVGRGRRTRSGWVPSRTRRCGRTPGCSGCGRAGATSTSGFRCCGRATRGRSERCWRTSSATTHTSTPGSAC